MITLITDLQYGSTGKGLIAGYLAETGKPDVVVNCNMPNAGHTYIDSRGLEMIFKVLPNGIVSPRLNYVMIGPGSVFDPNRLVYEIGVAQSYGYLMKAEILIHPNAMVLKPEHGEMEQQTLSGISSTMQGSMIATMEKMARDPGKLATAAHVYEPMTGMPVRVTNHEEWRYIITHARSIQAEGSQGFSLGLNGRFYPFCTSRECTPYRLLSDMGLPNVPVHTVGTLRTYPIRVGNTPDGYSGDIYPDQSELTWDELGVQAETTTVTGRIRRVFTFSRDQLRDALWECRPNSLFLNFCNYMDPASLGRLVDDIEEIADEFGTRINYFGYGPAYGDVLTRQLEAEQREEVAYGEHLEGADGS